MAKAARSTNRSNRCRCAIYTRKSSDEGLEQAFNSLDAQREACAAYILSQKHEGWTVLPTLYDDGGVSGGTLDRPALQRLLTDISARKVDVVVVYKIDRLTRSLFDFAKIVEAFDAHGVSFVSITQQFNTTTSMGRLTLNVLLSFAQFEREVAGERIRDKIAASKKKGMWMGGLPPLGYDVQDRKLVVNEKEARTVTHIFERYLELQSVRALQAELAAAGIRSKQRTLKDGTSYGAQKLSRGALYLMLQNRLYRGDITHKGNAYPGKHPAIIDEALWEEVQALLAKNRVARAVGSYAKQPSLLAGLVFDETGERLTPTHANKNGTRYRYYVSTSLITQSNQSSSTGRRIPAADLESLVVGKICRLLSDPNALLDVLHNAHADGAHQSALIARADQIAEELPVMAPDQLRGLLVSLLARIEVSRDRVEISVRRHSLLALLAGSRFKPTTQLEKPDADSADVLTFTVEARLQRVGREMRMLMADQNHQSSADPGLLRIIARAHDLQERLMHDKELTLQILAAQERVSAGYVSRLLRLPSLAPDIITAILNGKNPPQLTAKKLMRLAPKIPVGWPEQREMLGLS